MLINTVILFLKDILPVFLLLSLLLAHRHLLDVATLPKQKIDQMTFHRLLGYILVIGLLLSVGVINIVPSLSHYLDGRGVEVLYTLGYLAIYSLIVLGILFDNIRLLLIAMMILTLLRGADFLVYLQGYWSFEVLSELVIATLLGGGICMSIAILMYFMCCTLSRWRGTNVAAYLLLFFATGYLIKATHLLMQADFINNSQPFYSSNEWLNESSELGYFLAALVGYDASPTLLQLIAYGLGIGIPMICFIKINPQPTIDPKALA